MSETSLGYQEQYGDELPGVIWFTGLCAGMQPYVAEVHDELDFDELRGSDEDGGSWVVVHVLYVGVLRGVLGSCEMVDVVATRVA